MQDIAAMALMLGYGELETAAKSIVLDFMRANPENSEWIEKAIQDVEEGKADYTDIVLAEIAQTVIPFFTRILLDKGEEESNTEGELAQEAVLPHKVVLAVMYRLFVEASRVHYQDKAVELENNTKTLNAEVPEGAVPN